MTEPPAPAAWGGPTPQPLLGVDVLRWTIGALCAFLGALLLVAPHRFSAPFPESFEEVRLLWGALALAAGVALFATAVLRPPRAATVAAHALAGGVLLALASSFALAGIWVAAAAHVLLAAATIAGGLLPRRPPGAARRPDLFALVMAAVAATNGLALLLWPRLSQAAYFDPARPRLPALGLLLLAGGLLLAAAQLRARAPRAFVVAAHLTAGAGFVAVAIVVSLPQRAWTALGVNCGYALAVALTPWLAERLARHGAPTLRSRLALVLAAATSLALVATAALATWQQEQLATHEIRRARQAEAEAVAHSVAEFLRLTGEGRSAVAPSVARPGARVELWDGRGDRVAGGDAGVAAAELPQGWDAAVRAGRGVETGERLIGFARVPGRDWVVAVERPLAAELQGMRHGRDLALLLLLLVVPLAVVGGIFLAGRIARPLGALADAAAAMAAGDAPAPIAKSDIAEVEDLAAAFAELRQRLAERTRESQLLADELRARAAALAESDRRKDEFLAVLAHELRNPLGAIANSSAVLDHLAPEEPRVRKVSEIIRRQIQHLARLVDDLLDVSRITRGKITLRLEPLDLRDCVRQAVETARPLLDAKRHELRLDLPPEPLPVPADATRIDQIIGNLLRNAAKYTDPGGHIVVAAAAHDGEVVLSVRDDGRGIPAALLPQVFDLFVQGYETERAGSGLGIGLTLVRRLVELHGGRVEARSAGPGKGAEFVVRLPAA